ncbi:uncharacterized protein LOC112203853 [Rosa chinensis]|uniref:uncharacterized protein LOC112203853 n=1 Tax=Rosa chinensis TaxID=74649 RepID=UPI000D090A77|nr:uncharacterized protein LOC112203853 [Rosa chinensis]
MRWTPNFSPANQKNTNAQVWVQLWDLGLEFWEPITLFQIANGIGVRVKIDQNTLERKFGLFARVLVDIDLSSDPPQELAVRRTNGETVVIEVGYEKLPDLCSHCGNVGHKVPACKLVQMPNATQVVVEAGRGRSSQPRRRRRKNKQVYVIKNGEQVDKGKITIIDSTPPNIPDDGEGPSFASPPPLDKGDHSSGPNLIQPVELGETALVQVDVVGSAIEHNIVIDQLRPEIPKVAQTDSAVGIVLEAALEESEKRKNDQAINGSSEEANVDAINSGTEVSDAGSESDSDPSPNKNASSVPINSWYEEVEREPEFTVVVFKSRHKSSREASKVENREAYIRRFKDTSQ